MGYFLHTDQPYVLDNWLVQANLLDFCVVAESCRSEKRSREIEDRSERDRDPGLITRGDKIPDQMDLKTRLGDHTCQEEWHD